MKKIIRVRCFKSYGGKVITGSFLAYESQLLVVASVICNKHGENAIIEAKNSTINKTS